MLPNIKRLTVICRVLQLHKSTLLPLHIIILDFPLTSSIRCLNTSLFTILYIKRLLSLPFRWCRLPLGSLLVLFRVRWPSHPSSNQPGGERLHRKLHWTSGETLTAVLFTVTCISRFSVLLYIFCCAAETKIKSSGDYKWKFKIMSSSQHKYKPTCPVLSVSVKAAKKKNFFFSHTYSNIADDNTWVQLYVRQVEREF